MPSDHLFYKHSGKFGLGILFFGPLIVIPVAQILALVYTYASVYIPIVGIVTLLALGGFAFGMGVTISLLCMKFKVRNRTVCWLAGLATGLVTLYLSWASFIYVMVNRATDTDKVSLFMVISSPFAILQIARAICAEGWFSIGSSSSATVKGIPLLIIWFLEGLVLVFVPMVIAGKCIVDEVFCEMCKAWTEHVQGVLALEAAAATDFAQQARQGDLAGLASARRYRGPDSVCGRLDVWRCGSCKAFFALGVKRLETTVDSKGNSNTKESVLLPPMLIDADQYRTTMQAVKATPEPEAKAEGAGESEEPAAAETADPPPIALE